MLTNTLKTLINVIIYFNFFFFFLFLRESQSPWVTKGKSQHRYCCNGIKLKGSKRVNWWKVGSLCSYFFFSFFLAESLCSHLKVWFYRLARFFLRAKVFFFFTFIKFTLKSFPSFLFFEIKVRNLFIVWLVKYISQIRLSKSIIDSTSFLLLLSNRSLIVTPRN